MGIVMTLKITARALHTDPHGAAAAAQRWPPESTDRLTLEPAAGKRGRVRVRGAVVPWGASLQYSTDFTKTRGSTTGTSGSDPQPPGRGK